MTTTIDDLRRLLQEQTEHQKAEFAAVHGVLKELMFELRSGTYPKTGPVTPSGSVGLEQVEPLLPTDRSFRPKIQATEFDGALGLHMTASDRPEPEANQGGNRKGAARTEEGTTPENPAHGTSKVSRLRGMGFSMAKALGLKSRAGSTQEQEKPDTVVEVSDQPAADKTTKSFISRHAAVSARGRLSLLQRFVRSAVFENLTGFIVFVNAIVIGAHANLRALHPERCDDWNTVFWVFHVLFTLELITRIGIYRWEFVFGPEHRWNFFDSVIVIAGLLEEVIEAILGETGCATTDDTNSQVVSGITVLRILRVLRVVRIIKAFRTMTIFRDLRIMVASTLGCLVPLGWACLLLFFIQWCFSVYFLYLSTEYTSQAVNEFGIEVLDDDTKPYKELRTFFGSLWLSIFTLFQTITAGGDWGPPADVLYRVTGQLHPVILMMFYIALTVFAVLNVITGVFVENATKIAMQDRELVIQDAMSVRNQYKEDVLAVFQEADTDGSGQLTVEEFEDHLKDPRVQAFLESLELGGMGAARMFRLLDLNGNGSVDASEFVTGCMCLKGEAKTMDIASLEVRVNKISAMLSSSLARLEGRLIKSTSDHRLTDAVHV